MGEIRELFPGVRAICQIAEEEARKLGDRQLNSKISETERDIRGIPHRCLRKIRTRLILKVLRTVREERNKGNSTPSTASPSADAPARRIKFYQLGL